MPDDLFSQARAQAIAEHYRRPRDKGYKSTPGHARNVIGVSVGPKIQDGKPKDSCIRFYVEKKIRPLAAVDELFRIPEKLVGDVPTDVIEARRFTSFTDGVGPGTSIGLDYAAPNIDPALAGTLGAIVEVKGVWYALASNHVMAVNGRVPIGKRVIFNPIDKFIVNPNGYIFGRLKVFVPLRPEREGYDNPNRVDCALAAIENPDRVTGEAPGRIFDSADLVDPKPGESVHRVDESESATGVIEDVNARLRIDYPFGTFDFEDMVLIKGYNGPFANPGDSGALVVNDQRKPTAMIVGGSQNYTIACKLSNVRDELRDELANQLQLSSKEAGFQLVLDKLKTGKRRAPPSSEP